MIALRNVYSLFWYIVTFLNIGLVFLIEGALPGVDPIGFKIVRYALIAFLFVISFKRKKLSLWIFSSMILKQQT